MTARLEMQDCGTPWKEWSGDTEEARNGAKREDTLLAFARQFYFGG